MKGTHTPRVRRGACVLGLVLTSVFIMSASQGLRAEEMPSQEEMWRIIQMQAEQLNEQKAEIDKLKNNQQQLEVNQGETQQAVQETQKQVAQTRSAAADDGAYTSMSRSTGSSGGWWERTSLGGYGELHYEGGSKDQVDFHRFVVFLSHEFNDRIRLFSELELEHALAGSGQPGEVELEQAYIQFDIHPQHRINAGLQLVPVGILNLTHEPPSFFGVERNPVEANIIPTTWWEAALGFAGDFGASGFSYDAVVSSGLEVPLAGADAFKIRNGRQKVANAPANAPAMTGRLRYSGLPGVEVAATGRYEFDVTQGMGDPITGEKVDAFLLSGHVDAEYNGFGLRALYAAWWLDGPSASAIGRDHQAGFYIEPSYRFALPWEVMGSDLGDLGFFYRYSHWDNNSGLDSLNMGTTQHTVGLNFWPHPDVVLKADFFWQVPDVGATEERLNLGAGFQF